MMPLRSSKYFFFFIYISWIYFEHNLYIGDSRSKSKEKTCQLEIRFTYELENVNSKIKIKNIISS